MSGAQLELLAGRPLAVEPVTVRARATDPDTSREAAAAFEADEAKGARSVRTVVEILRRTGPLSDFQIRAKWAAAWAGPFSDSLPCKARHWARQQGLVQLVGHGKHGRRKVQMWHLGADAKYLASQQRKAGHVATLRAIDAALEAGDAAAALAIVRQAIGAAP